MYIPARMPSEDNKLTRNILMRELLKRLKSKSVEALGKYILPASSCKRKCHYLEERPYPCTSAQRLCFLGIYCKVLLMLSRVTLRCASSRAAPWRGPPRRAARTGDVNTWLE